MIAVEELLKPISAENPCGEDSTYDPSFQQLETLVRGKPETQFSEAEEPDWKELKALSTDFFGKSKHLTAGVILALCLLKTESWTGFRDGLAVLRGLLEQYWDTIFPRLDPEDNNDPTERINILKNLVSSVEPYPFLPALQHQPICSSPRMGRICLAEIVAAAEQKPGEEGQKSGPDASLIEATFRDSDPETLQATHAGVVAAMEHVRAIDSFLNEKVGAGQAVDFAPLSKVLVQVERSIAPYLEGGAPAEAGFPEAGEEAGEPAPGAASPRQPAQGFSGKVQSRTEVLKALGQIIDFYKENEPSSPVPLLLRRAQRMVTMNYVELVTELTPDAMSQLQIITGSESSEES